MARRHWYALAIAGILLFGGVRNTHAQSQAAEGQSRPLGDSANAGQRPGGAVIADFDTLTNLIMQTIDPDSWVLNGGNNSMLPYPAGVYVDPKGAIKRLKPTDNSNVASDFGNDTATPRHPWRQSSKLRTVSLKQLDNAIRKSVEQGIVPSREIDLLAGLSRIEYVKIDIKNEDVLLAGPANEHPFGLMLQDVATVASLVKAETPAMGCSIEPTDQGVLAAQELSTQRGAADRLARNPKAFVQQMQEKIGPHKVRVFGMPEGCSTAMALLDADEHMKRVGFGQVDTVPRIATYFDFLAEQDSIPSQSLVRWWFAYSDDPIEADANEQIFRLPENSVRVMSQQQWVTAQGGRAPSGGVDVAADKFAREMTEHLPLLRRSESSYSRLSNVFETGLALQLAVEVNGQADLRAWFPTLCNLGKTLWKPAHANLPKTVDGLTTSSKLPNGMVVAVVSGGVRMDLSKTANRQHWSPSKFLAASNIPEPQPIPPTSHETWWWD